MRILQIFLVLLSAIWLAQAQNLPRLDFEQEQPNCETLLVGVDQLNLALASEPDSRGAIVVSGPLDQIPQKLAYEIMLKGALMQRTPEISKRINIVRGGRADKIQLSYWIVPAGASLEIASGWDLVLPKTTKPIMLQSEMAQICEHHEPARILGKELLDANHEGIIVVIVHGQTPLERKRELSRAIKALSSLDARRVRFFLRKGSAYSDYYFALGNPPRTAFKSYF